MTEFSNKEIFNKINESDDVVATVDDNLNANGNTDSDERCCVLHVGDGYKVGKINLFNTETLGKCKSILVTRKNGNLKYKDTQLPGFVNKIQGFHLNCYKRFIALSETQRKNLPNDKKVSKAVPLTRSKISITVQSSSTGVFSKICIFCMRKEKKHKNLKQKLNAASTENFQENIKKYARWLEDKPMLVRIGNEDFVSKEIYYHGMCRVSYQSKAEKTPLAIQERNEKGMERQKLETSWHTARGIHCKAFEGVCAYIDDHILKEKDVILLSELKNQYHMLLAEIGNEAFEDIESSSAKLEQKLLKHYKESIQIMKGKTRRGNLIFCSTISEEEAFRKEYSMKTKLKAKIRDVAFALRSAIMEIEKCPIPDEVTFADIKKGEVEAPNELIEFFSYLIGGPDQRIVKSNQKQRRIKSIADDVIFAATSGKKKPAKHLQLGLAVKSITGSKKVIEMLNRLGHSVSYSIIEELETELTFTSTKAGNATPHGMKLMSSLGTGVAFDNFDRFVETLSGKDTLHDTVGIAYQVVSQNNDKSLEEDDDSTLGNSQLSGKKKRRSFLAVGLDIEPYRKKPKMLTRIMLPLDDQRRASEPLSYIKARMYDTLWMMDFYFSPDTTPMWVGWNSIIFQNTNNLQKVWYLPQINQSPTSIAVVAETLRRAQVIANECGKKNISVTYDLAIAKVAMQLQAEESPKFDNIFVALGAFHVEMAMFSAFGKYIAESGGPHILNEAGVIEKGSLKSFLLGKCYKRSKRCHQILALAMEILHFQYFLQEREEIQLKEDIQEEIKFIKSQEPLNLHEGHEVSKEVNNVLREYSQFRQDTEKGNHGATAQYWMGYVEMIRLYHDFSRSLRDGNFDLYVCCLPKVANYFFSMNHPNYARWIVRYHDNLLKLKDSHPEVYTEFQRGLFSLRRTQKSFSRLPIDLTLEQTINADAACQRKGISALTNSISARQRWAQSHSIRTSIVSYVFENLGMTKQEDVSQDLKASRMRQNSKDLHQVINMVKETMNPFNDAIEKQYLFNIASGKAASPDTTKFLLNIVSVGSKARDKFIDECSKDPARFEKPIRRQTLHTFATGGTKYNIKAADNKVVAVTMMRDLFGSILYHSLQRKIDMAEVLKYPLTPVPLSLGHVDGKMQKTPKVKLLNELEAKVKTDDPNRVDVNIIDGMFFLHLFVDLPATFGALATFILKRVCASKGNIIHFVLDKMVHPSIKDCERDLRCTERHGAYQITGPEQKRPSNWLNALRNDHFKAALVEFLAFFWENNMHSTVLGNKTVIMNRNDTCYMFRVEGEIVVKTEIVKLFSTHEEADSRILYHLSSIQTPANVVIRTIDTDVLIIALGCLSKLPNSLNIWMETGVYTKNTLRYISINQIYQKLGKNICMALPAYHAFTGCDYTASFSRKGKIRPFKLLEKNESVQDVFKQLGTNLDVTDDAFATLEKFVCSMYGKRNLSSVDEARLVMFLEKYKPKGENEAISCVKKFDGSSLPPCLRVLRQKIYRTKYVAQLWMSSITSEPPNHLPEDMGWLLKDGSYIIKWYEGEMSPKAVDVTSNENYYGFSREVEDFEGFDELSSDDDSDSDDETSDEDV